MPQAKKKRRSNPEWIKRHVTDPFVKRSVQEGFRSRAAYKLTEIADTDRLLKPGMVVVELGAAPGSWTQVVRKRQAGPDGKPRGRIVALDSTTNLLRRFGAGATTLEDAFMRVMKEAA